MKRTAIYLGVSWLSNFAVLAIVAWLLDKVTFSGGWSLIIAAAVFGVLNTCLKPLLRLVTAPLAVVTFGLAWFGVSMLMLAITSWLVDGFAVHGFWGLVWATVAVWAVNLAAELIFSPWRRKREKK